MVLVVLGVHLNIGIGGVLHEDRHLEGRSKGGEGERGAEEDVQERVVERVI